MAERVIRNQHGEEMTISSPDLTESDLALAEILLELAAEQGSCKVLCSPEELERRLAAKGYDPSTGNRIH
jgi:hypothetical protein